MIAQINQAKKFLYMCKIADYTNAENVVVIHTRNETETKPLHD